MGQLERLLPAEWKRSGRVSGNELVLEWSRALGAIRIATENQVAILGFEAFELREDGLLTVDYSGYDRDVSCSEDWNSYVRAMNDEAVKWINAHRFDANHGYIVTSATEGELAEARKLLRNR